MVAATSAVASILRGVLGIIIAPTRITTVLQESCPTNSVLGGRAQLFSSATPAALTMT